MRQELNQSQQRFCKLKLISTRNLQTALFRNVVSTKEKVVEGKYGTNFQKKIRHLYPQAQTIIRNVVYKHDRLCGLVVRVLGYRSGGPGSILGTTREKKVVGLERSPLSLVSTTEELFDRKSSGSCL
jgi:hypothetical protein